MEALHTWIAAQIAGKHVEPNSGLGKALNFKRAVHCGMTLR